jgi:heterodisulfide reductase subunit A-like polyferredoxin
VNIAHHKIALANASSRTYGRGMEENTPVLIIGGSLVGLTTAMLLGHHGVKALSVERHAGTAIHVPTESRDVHHSPWG